MWAGVCKIAERNGKQGRTVESTRQTLLQRVRQSGDDAAWREFHRLYGDFLYRYARQRGLAHEDAEDIRGECLQAVADRIKRFEYDAARGRFRSWLREIAHHKVVDLLRKRRMPIADTRQLQGKPDEHNAPDALWDMAWKSARLTFCLDRVSSQVSSTVFHAFHLTVMEQHPVADVAATLGISANQVYKAKAEVLRRLRSEFIRLE